MGTAPSPQEYASRGALAGHVFLNPADPDGNTELGEADGFKVFEKQIQTPGGGVIIFTGLHDSTAERIKSLEGFRRAWVEEAQALSHRSLALLRPTIRAKGSQIWASWNPRRKGDAIDDFLRGRKPQDSVIVEVNWRDNPWFPAVLEEERRTDLRLFADRYDHIWQGGYAKALDGAYFSRALAQAKEERRICRVAADPLLPVRAFFDIGGSGASADAMAIWIAQFVDREIRVLDYIEGVGQVLGFYVAELRARGWGQAHCVLPHDGVAENGVTGKRYEDRPRDDPSPPAHDRRPRASRSALSTHGGAGLRRAWL
jgi:phage terminase large subunit